MAGQPPLRPEPLCWQNSMGQAPPMMVWFVLIGDLVSRLAVVCIVCHADVSPKAIATSLSLPSDTIPPLLGYLFSPHSEKAVAVATVERHYA